MYYIAQISRQSNEMLTDFRDKMEELDDTVQVIKEKVSSSVDSLGLVSKQIGYVFEFIRGLKATGGKKSKPDSKS